MNSQSSYEQVLTDLRNASYKARFTARSLHQLHVERMNAVLHQENPDDILAFLDPKIVNAQHSLRAQVAHLRSCAHKAQEARELQLRELVMKFRG